MVDGIDYNPKDKAKTLKLLLDWMEKNYPGSLREFEITMRTGINPPNSIQEHLAENKKNIGDLELRFNRQLIAEIKADANRHDRLCTVEGRTKRLEDSSESHSVRLSELELNIANITTTLKMLFPGKGEA